MQIAKIILASHGTKGAIAAENHALDMANDYGASLHQLLVVPDFWKGMMGDDWLNNAVTQIRFGKYVENQLAAETAEEITRVEDMAKSRGIAYSHHITLGKPEECLIDACSSNSYDIAIIGSPRPKNVSGYRSRMKLDPLTRALNIRLLIIPYPKP